MINKFLFSLVATGCVLTASAQKATEGNIVEIFGKDRIERVDEGEYAYKFTQGYMLPNSGKGGYFYPSRDVLSWEILSGKFVAPSPENLRATNYGRTREIIQWTPITADSTGKFRDRVLRGGYLYGEFNSPKSETLLLAASANMRSIINGMPHEGDYYDFAYTLIPFKAKKGVNQFLFTPGRYGFVEASIIRPDKPVMFSERDMTLAHTIIGETNEKWGAIRVVNSSAAAIKDLTIVCEMSTGESATYETGSVMDMTTRKLPFLIPATSSKVEGMQTATLSLIDGKGKVIDKTEIEIKNVDGMNRHERTFISSVDGSVQYYAVTPSTKKADNQALFLSVHGASVEARNQAGAYAHKDWGHIICPTNRRPFGFNWEDIGRIDAMETLAEAKKVFKTAPEMTYLTGHSMGGHGTWHLGVTYPDQFAAIAPCASYPDIADYGAKRAPLDDFNRGQFAMIERAAHAGRTKELKRNYLQSGIYILHGDDDTVVPIDLVREMRQILDKFHPDVAYYEYPGGSHWYSNESVDWKPIFDYFSWHKIPATNKVNHIEFETASPGVSASNYWATIAQQQQSYEFSKINLDVKGDSVVGTTKNVSVLKLDFDNMPISGDVVVSLDGWNLNIVGKGVVTLRQKNGKWSVGSMDELEKSNLRAGNFKEVFANNAVLVYSTKGTKAENEWYKNKARFDAETMLYRGNGSFEVVSDREFLAGDYDGRNVVIYGNSKTNAAWSAMLSASPIQVNEGSIAFGSDVKEGDDLAAYFVYPRPGSDRTLVGVVAGSGLEGAKATYPNDYLLANTGFPDVIIFDLDALRDGLSGIDIIGYFGNEWDIKSGEFFIAD